MGYIKIPVYKTNPFDSKDVSYFDRILEWLAEVHVDSFFIMDCIDARKEEGVSTFKEVILSNLKNQNLYLSEITVTFKDEEAPIPHEGKQYRVEDIKLEKVDASSGEEDSKTPLFIIRIDFIGTGDCASDYYKCEEYKVSSIPDRCKFIKHLFEEKLTELFFSPDDIVIPSLVNKDYKTIIGKMIVALKGKCNFEEVSDITFLEEWLTEGKYRWIRKKDIKIINSNNPGCPEIVRYDYPKERKWADIIHAMGDFSSDKEDNCKIRICPENIKRTLRFMNTKERFNGNIISG